MERMAKSSEKYIFRDGFCIKLSKRGTARPICNNDLFQPLVIKKQTTDLDMKEDYHFGCLLNSLLFIILNNRRFKFQNQSLREDIRLEMLHDILTEGLKHYDSSKGTAYAYLFRVGYVAGIHILERENKRREILTYDFERIEEEE